MKKDPEDILRKYMPIRELMQRLGVSNSTVWNYIHHPREGVAAAPKPVTIGCSPYFRRSEIEPWLKSTFDSLHRKRGRPRKKAAAA